MKNTAKLIGGLFVTLALVAADITMAADGTWNGASVYPAGATQYGELWSDSTNWYGTPGVIAGAVGTTTSTDTMYMNTQGHYTVDLDANYNVQNIYHYVGSHTHAITSQNGSTLSLTNGGSITSSSSDGGPHQYYAAVRLEGGNGGSYSFLGRRMGVYGAVSGTAATGGNYDLILGGATHTSGSEVGTGGNLTDGAGGGTLSVIKIGSGIWTLTSANTYTGTTTVRQGTLKLTNPSGFGNPSGPIMVCDSGTGALDNVNLHIENGATISSAYDIQVNNYGNTVTLTHNVWNRTWSGDIALNRDINFASNAHELTLTGSISGTGGFTKTGAGSLKLSAANTHQGDTVVSAGTLNLNNLNALQNSTLDTGTSGSQTVSFAASGTYNIGGLAGADDLATGTNTISVGGNGQTTEYTGILSSTGGGLTKVGGGMLTLSGDNTYTGQTNVDAGSLLIDGDQSLATGAVNVNGSATLGGSGIIGGTVTVASTASLTPGTSPGELTLLNGLDTSGTLVIDLEGPTQGSEYDVIRVTGGDATLGGTLNIELLPGYRPTLGTMFEVVTVTGGGSLINNGISLVGASADLFIMDFDSGTGVFSLVSQIPEPASAMIVGLAGLLALRRRRA